MPFPFALIPALVSAYGALKNSGESNPGPAPNFFANNPEELLALIRHSTQSEYGGVNTRIRETLGDQGLFSSGAYPNAVTQAQIGLGQESARAIGNFGIDQVNQAQSFQSHEYLTRLESMLNEHRTNQEAILTSLGQIGSGLGDILNKPQDTNADPLNALIKKKQKTGKKQILTEDQVYNG